jgi:hypothetical protein
MKSNGMKNAKERSQLLILLSTQEEGTTVQISASDKL